jgi:hypothetical protein
MVQITIAFMIGEVMPSNHACKAFTFLHYVCTVWWLWGRRAFEPFSKRFHVFALCTLDADCNIIQTIPRFDCDIVQTTFMCKWGAGKRCPNCNVIFLQYQPRLDYGFPYPTFEHGTMTKENECICGICREKVKPYDRSVRPNKFGVRPDSGCGHWFHRDCRQALRRLGGGNRRCPNCKKLSSKLWKQMWHVPYANSA